MIGDTDRVTHLDAVLSKLVADQTDHPVRGRGLGPAALQGAIESDRAQRHGIISAPWMGMEKERVFAPFVPRVATIAGAKCAWLPAPRECPRHAPWRRVGRRRTDGRTID